MDKELESIVQQLLDEGRDDAFIEQVVTEYESQKSGKTSDPQQEDAIVGLEDTASSLEEPSSVSPEEFEQERAAKEAGYRAAHSSIPGAAAIVGSLPDGFLEPYAAFESTLLGFGSGIADFATQQYARFDKKTNEEGKTISQQLEEATPEERNAIWDSYNTAGDTIRDAVDASQFAEQRGSGSITKELYNGNIANAAQLTANQTAAGLASLVPFMVPGGAIIGPAVLGSSAAAGEFETYIDEGKIDQRTGKLATMDQIYNASYLKGGAEFATEFVTAGILGRASKLASGGAPKALVDKYTKGAVRSVLGDAFAEGVSEGATDTAGRFIDKAIFGDEIDWKDAAVGFIDSAIVGAIVGGKVSTFGAAAATQQGKQYAAQALRTEQQKNEDDADAKEIQAQTDAINEINAKATEGSLVDEVLLEQAEQARDEAIDRTIERKKDHVRTLDDMTKSELVEYAKSLEASKSINEALKDESLTDDARSALERKKQEEDTYANEQYQIVQQWPTITKEAADIESRLDEEIKLVEMEEAQAAKAEQPNPVGTARRNTKKKELQEKKKGLNEELDSKRPTVAEAKTRKRKAKTKPVEVAKDAAKPIKDKAKRTEANNDLVETIKDPDIPQPQKEKAWNDFFKINAPLVTSIANTVANKTGRTDRKDIKDLVKTEITNQINKKGTFDNKAINNASKAVERLLTSEDTTVRTPRQDSVKKELREIDQQVLDGTLDPEAAEILKDDIRNEAASTIELEQQTEEGAVIPAYIEKAYDTAEAPSQQQKKAYDKILKDTTVDELAGDISNNTDNLFKLLPESAKSGKAFSGIFSGGNPAVEIWESYFDKSDRKGKDRIRELKKAINKNVSEVKDEASTTNIDNTEAFTDSIEFLEDKQKTKVKMFLPLLSKLKRNFPGSKIIISKSKMIEDFIAAGIDPGKADTVKGYTDGKNVVLNPEKLDAETPIHEFGHIWAQTTRQERPDLYKKGAELIKKSSEYLELQEKVKDKDSIYYGKSREQVIEEAMATAIGKHGEEIFESKEDQSQWNKLRDQIWDWISKQVGISKVQDLTLDQFVKLAATEIITGEKFVTRNNIKDMEVSLTPKEAQYLVKSSGTTKDYAQATAPIVEADTHGVFKGVALSKEIDGLIDKHGPALDAGGWIGWTTGSYGAAVEGTSKFDPKLNARIQSKVDGMGKYLNSKGYSLRQDPVNPGFHVIRKKPEYSFSESDLSQTKVLKNLLNGKLLYKSKSPYRKSKIDQATRDILNATKRDFALRGHLLNEAGVGKLITSLEDLIKHGKDAQKAKLDNAKSLRKAQSQKAADIVNEISGIDIGSLTPAGQARRAKQQGSFIKDLKQGKVGNAVARLLSPDSNNDFYGLLYNLMPKGANRGATKKYLKENITDVLEDANYNYLMDKSAFSQNWKDIMDQNGFTRKSLNKNSGIVVDGLEISDSQVAKIYNYIKDPSLYTQLEKGGVTVAKMNEILNYLDTKPQLKKLADQVPSIYAGSQAVINSKLDAHGFKGVQNPDIVKPEAGPALDVLARVYNGEIPLQAPYTPFTAQGADTSLEIENVFEGDGDYYSVMSGNLKRRTGGGAIDIHGKNLESDIDNYQRGPLRTQAYLDFARNSSNFFTGQNMKGMEAAFGKEWSLSMKDGLKRIITGRNNPTNETASAKAVRNFINNTVGGIMFLNTRSAVLQLISTANFSVQNPSLYGKGLLSKRKGEALRLIQDSAWYKARGEGRSQLELAEIFDSQKRGAAGKALQSVLQEGYRLTQLGDKGAIAYGGAPLVAALLDQGMNPDEALKEFIRQSEETQQSVRAERLGREQTSTFGRAILAFANTPMQYNRKMQKAFKDLIAKGSTKQEKAAAVRSIIYYGGMQNAIFTAAQQGLWTAVGLDDKEDEDKVLGAVNSMADTILRGSGIYGAVAATMKNILREFMKDDKRLAADKAAQALINTVPALGTKVRQLKKAAPGSRLYRESKGLVKVDASVIRAANAVTFATNIPLDRAVKKLEGINDLAAKDLNEIEKIFRVLGWGRYNLGKKGTPLKRAEGGVWGRANKDGSIEVNPNLSPAQKKQTIQHEKAHQREMENGKLDYDDDFVYYDGQQFARKGGKIEINGNLVPEGDSSLPWEQVAEAAESPLKQTDPEPGTPEWEAARQQGVQFNKEWYEDPTTKALLEQQAPKYTDRTGVFEETHFQRAPHLEEGEIAEYWRNPFPEEGEHKHNVGIGPGQDISKPGLIEHELTHAAGFDYHLGKEAQKYLGEGKLGGRFGRYLDSPDEAYANLQELRAVLELKPGDRNLKPEQIKKLLEEKGGDDQKAYIKNFGVENVTEALNKVAATDKKRSLEDLYSRVS